MLFVLAGLDECKHERDDLIRTLSLMQKTFKVLICTSFRAEASSVSEIRNLSFLDQTRVLLPDTNPDIEAFVEAELRFCVSSGKLSIGDPALIVEICGALCDGANGMFLWVVLQIKTLCLERTDDALRDAIKNLPRDLSKTFEYILRKSADARKPFQRRILELIAVAQRPLTSEELQEALSVEIGDTEYRPASQINDVESTMACCSSLITVDEEGDTVRFLHHSVVQFLFTEYQDTSGLDFSITAANQTMSDIIVTYLNYGIFESQLTTQVIPKIEGAQLPTPILRFTFGSLSKSNDLIMKFLKYRKEPGFDMGRA